jgi:hypothetical protein
VVPDILFRCSDREIAAFIQAYLDGDGSVGRVGIRATTKSRRLAFQLQLLLSRLGVVAFRGTIRSRANRDKPFIEYATLSVYGDDAVTLGKCITPRCERKRRRLELFVDSGVVGKSRSRWDTIPIRAALFKRIRQGLGLTRRECGLEGAIKNIEYGLRATRASVNHLLDVLERHDARGLFREELRYLRLLAAPDIAWDRVVEVSQRSADVPFLYDLSVADSECFIANGIVAHNTHGHSLTTGAIKNAFGGLLKEVRHYAHEFIHEVMVDLMLMQRELHPGVFAVMDGTVMGDGAGPRTMVPRVGNLILASADQVAIDAIAARIMGFDPLEIRYLRMCHERGLGVADPRDIEILGDPDAASTTMGFKTSRSLVIWGDQLIRRGPLRPLKRLLLHTPLVAWAPFASNVYHDMLWYPTIGRSRIREFSTTPWGHLFTKY